MVTWITLVVCSTTPGLIQSRTVGPRRRITYHLPSSKSWLFFVSSIDAMNDGSEGCRSESLLKMNIVGVNAGDEIELQLKKVPGGKKLLLRAFAVDHCGHPALGYVIISRKSPGLKPEYQGLPGKSIRDLVQSGVQVKGGPVEAIEVAYTGDTSVAGIVRRNSNSQSCSDAYLNQAFRAPLILCEATFLDPTMKDLAKSRGHMSIEDVATVLSSHEWINLSNNMHKVVLFHVSSRHRPAERALSLILEHLPAHMADNCDVAISALLSDEERRESKSLADLIKSNGCISLKEYMNIQLPPSGGK